MNREACDLTYREVTHLLKRLRSQVTHNGLHKAEAIRAVESMYEVALPTDYRQFLGNYGALRVGDITIIGLGEPERIGLPVDDAILMLRLAHPDMPSELVPIEDLDNGYFACLLCSGGNTKDVPVVIVNTAQPGLVDQLPRVAPCFCHYLYNRLLMLVASERTPGDSNNVAPQPVSDEDIQERDLALDQLLHRVEEYQERFHYNHHTGGALSQSRDWRPYRYCIQDVLFGATVVRHNRLNNCLEVDVFLTAHISEYDPLAGAHALAAFLLSEAYKCGSSMELKFTRHVEGGAVPRELRDVALGYGVRFQHGRKGRVTPQEAKALYAALTQFSPTARARIQALEQSGQLTMESACYAVHHGVWSREQVEMLVAGSPRPDSVLRGLALPHERHLYASDLLHARSAVLGGLLDRKLTRKERIHSDGTSYDLEDDVLPLDIDFEDEHYAKRYRSDNPLPVPWLYSRRDEVIIPPRQDFYVLVRARDPGDLTLHPDEDLAASGHLRKTAGLPVYILLPGDFLELSGPIREHFLSRADDAKVSVMVCPETIASLDAEAASRLARSRILRQ